MARTQQKQKRLRRGGKNTQRSCTKKVFMTQITRWCVHSPRARILEWEVKWALGSLIRNKASGGDGIPAKLFQVLKDDAVKVLHSICQQIWKTQQWPQDQDRSVFIPILKKGNAKECSNCAHLTCQQGNAQNPSSYSKPRQCIKKQTSLCRQRSIQSKLWFCQQSRRQGCESQTIKKAQYRRMMLWNCGVGEDS